MREIRTYDVVLNFKLVKTFPTLEKAEYFIKKSGIDYDIMIVDAPDEKRENSAAEDYLDYLHDQW